MDKLAKEDKCKIAILNIVIFIFLLVFFINICPIVPYDTDDWIYIGQMRMPLPLWNGWNPTKVLPEILMPLCGYVSAYLVYPIIGNYFFAITITAAVLLTAFILLLCLCIMQFMRRRLHLSVNLSLVLEVLFLIFNFMIFRNRGTSRCMFSAANMNCIFNYTIPGIVNAIAVLIMMQYEDFQEAYKSFSTLKKGLFIILIYFAIFSNIFHSETIAIYCGIILLGGFIKAIRNKMLHLQTYIQQHRIYLIILCTWIMAIIFEMSGGRASNVSAGTRLQLSTSIRQLYALIQALANPFAIITAVALGWLGYHIVKNYTKYHKLDINSSLYLFVLFNMALLVIYLIVLCSGVNYMSRIEASWNIWFYVILLSLLGIADFVSLYPMVKPILIPTLVVCAVLAYYPDGKFLMSTVGNVDYATCVDIGEHVTEQIIEAEQAGETAVYVHVPMYADAAGEWKFDDNYCNTVVKTLYNHGLIHGQINAYAKHDVQ